MIVVDPERETQYNPVRELVLLGLTRSEARLGALIGAGCSRAEAAGALGISASTANDTIKKVYSKLDISRQSQLVQLVDRLAAIGSRRPGIGSRADYFRGRGVRP
jgi:DNA-binding CsgD family transcriptional regulator